MRDRSPDRQCPAPFIERANRSEKPPENCGDRQSDHLHRSQNCADAEFLVKAKYAPWVDAMMRFEGPVARQNQYLFLEDWMSHVDEDLTELLSQPEMPITDGFVAQSIGTGPTYRESAIAEVFESLMYFNAKLY